MIQTRRPARVDRRLLRRAPPIRHQVTIDTKGRHRLHRDPASGRRIGGIDYVTGVLLSQLRGVILIGRRWRVLSLAGRRLRKSVLDRGGPLRNSLLHVTALLDFGVYDGRLPPGEPRCETDRQNICEADANVSNVIRWPRS
jgi:hypothetical protein